MPNMYARPKGPNTNRGRSREMWINCPIQEIRDDFSAGLWMEDDFITLQDGDGWTFTDNTATGSAATFALNPGVHGGEALLSSVSAVDTEGGQIQWGTSAFVPSATRTIWFETLIDLSVVSADLFVGLSEVDTSVLASGAITSANHVGFLHLTADGVLLQVGEKAGTADLAGTTGYTLTADGKVKLGFIVHGLTSVEFWVNGVRTAKAQDLATANIPAVGVTPTFCCHSGSTTPSVMSIDWVACYMEDRDAVTLQASA